MRDSITAARISGPTLQPGGAATVEFRFRADDPTFAGHFPGQPILPGVFQLEMARMAAEWLLNAALTVREISRAKFLRPILPEQIVRLDLRLSGKGEAIEARASFSVDAKPAAEVSMLLAR
jgi:3-hydroxyacyl-[acyl-carrier-protein] dehydratase